MGLIWNLIFITLFSFISPNCGFDVLDPNGNVTIKWDKKSDTGDTQFVTVSIYNYQLFRHIDQPGWKLSWTWRNKEVIWKMLGAEATEQGNCSAFTGDNKPHCCVKKPVIVDLLPGAPYNSQSANCCKGGVLTSITQDPTKYISSFDMSVGGSVQNPSSTGIPDNFTLGLPGYTCGPPIEVEPTKFYEDNGRRKTQAIATWNVSCSYSQFLASPTPKCCVSFSAFYNSTIVPCPTCSCGCNGQPGINCVKPGQLPQVLKLPNDEPRPLVKCTRHMCPVTIHWHVKESYKEYWRVKMTITNQNFAQNYSQWSLVVLHPNLKSVTQVFSFNYLPLNQYGNINDSGVFYGIKYYNDMLLQSGEQGNVQSEMLLHKDPDMFTFRQGWTFPRKVSFNGDECVMPQPDDYPSLPNSAQRSSQATFFNSIMLLPLFVSVITMIAL
ncbi:COBRA-like protein 6 [Heracleum sosnowskyi]|uniref:COBRA-like protein n=1 Tax=Heracleum sosnowskyi TaxID=360622 RepID=A0AAD8JGU8_9APIA|nr:COBRA-like protein 6 [Heracleum sosnowskyi]KAK1402162.1 COBRA-like protein 6 [Heracleum sosnowskyi]KAK1402165.1 COBRA-like protein 6 [Heracleum sosnowskyi]